MIKKKKKKISNTTLYYVVLFTVKSLLGPLTSAQNWGRILNILR